MIHLKILKPLLSNHRFFNHQNRKVLNTFVRFYSIHTNDIETTSDTISTVESNSHSIDNNIHSNINGFSNFKSSEQLIESNFSDKINSNIDHENITNDDSNNESMDYISSQYLSLTDPLKSQNSGVFRESEVDDIKVLVYNFTAPVLAEALRQRETQLQSAATFFFNNDMVSLKDLLTPFLKANVEKRRVRRHALNLEHGFTRKEIVILQRYLHRIPRQIFQGET